MTVKKTAQKTHWLRTTLCVLIACAIVGTVLSAVLFYADPDQTTASASIEFLFDGAADGIAPNGYAFNVEDVRSEEILGAALTAAGLADRYTAEQIRPWVRADGVYPETIVSQMMAYESILNFNANRTLTLSSYHPTQYRVSVSSEFDKSISQKDLEALLKALLDTYREDFTRRYAMTNEASMDVSSLENFDYSQYLDILSNLIRQYVTYARAMHEKDPTFTLNGMSFNDIVVRMNNLSENDIDRLNASVTMNGLSKDISRLMSQYQYEIRNLTIDLSKKQDQLKKLDALIASYEKNEIIYVATAESMTRIDGNSSETYDALTDRRKVLADEITDINTQIVTYQLRLGDLTKGIAQTAEPAQATEAAETTETTEKAETEETAVTAAMEAAEPVVTPDPAQLQQQETEKFEAYQRQIALMEAAIQQLIEKGREIREDFDAMLQAYNGQKINDLTVYVSNYKYEAPKLLSGAFIKKVLKTAGPICALGLIVCLALIIVSRRKEEKALQA